MVLVHLDLGIGGAERLVVNIALSLLALGHDVTIVTTHHDPLHCFEETRGEGALAGKVVVVGDWLPRQILGFGTALCSNFRMVYASVFVLLRSNLKPNVVFMDGVSIPLPLYLWAGIPTIFYCHYPDMLLCSSSSRSSFVGKAYRSLLDTAEEWTTACATTILVNSLFTKETFRRTFTELSGLVVPQVLYPTLEETHDREEHTLPEYLVPNQYLESGKPGRFNMFVSLNRYERKKRVELALEALAILKKDDPAQSGVRLLLVIAGGFDERVAENVQYLGELQSAAEKLGLRWSFPTPGSSCTLDNIDVIFRVSISATEREGLLRNASALLYTPENEHFGIVPLEAMRSGTPVIAVNNGGPVETIIHENTGYLCNQTPKSFADAMKEFLGAQATALSMADKNSIVRSLASNTMGDAGRLHVKKHFTAKAMRDGLEACLKNTHLQSLSTQQHQKIYGNKCLTLLSLAVACLVAIFIRIVAVVVVP